ncbi:unnamed protein product [Rotaria socialis]|uniref:Uncharacterized protein n=1 Tax=Rotaria socialis TaxID=392032 RepID=A0A821A8M8_9BILA|nr:unnamed protein product [Rotaria socialis]
MANFNGYGQPAADLLRMNAGRTAREQIHDSARILFDYRDTTRFEQEYSNRIANIRFSNISTPDSFRSNQAGEAEGHIAHPPAWHCSKIKHASRHYNSKRFDLHFLCKRIYSLLIYDPNLSSTIYEVLADTNGDRLEIEDTQPHDLEAMIDLNNNQPPPFLINHEDNHVNEDATLYNIANENVIPIDLQIGIGQNVQIQNDGDAPEEANDG